MPKVGEVLRSEREKKGLSIKDIEAGTNIRSLYLNAIEQDDYGVLPGEVYLKGFIGNYAKFLGLDSKQILDLYRQSKTEKTEVTQVNSVVNPQSTANIIQSNANIKSNDEQSDVTGSKTNYLFVVVFLILLVAGFGWWFIGKNQDQYNINKDNTAPVPSVPAQPLPQTELPKPATPSPTINPPVAQTKPVVVKATYSAECWTLVIADGKEIYEGIPNKGDTITWQAEQDVIIKLGNAAGVDIVYNGQAQDKLGAVGEVVEKKYSAKR